MERATQAAGIWRDTADWGAAYSMVMTEACEHVAGVHDRMPAILPRSDWGERPKPSESVAKRIIADQWKN